MNTLDFGLEVKDITDEGVISGYGAVFNNIDDYGDRIVPGAFAKSLAKHAASGSPVPMLWGHDSNSPIGMFPDLAEDRKGLKVTGKLVMEVPRAREVLALLKAGAVRGLSIGYRTLADAIEGNVRLLKEIDLWEISLTPFPANAKAVVTGVKSAHPLDDFARRLRDGEPPKPKEFEDILREAGIPKSLAVQIASVGYVKAIRSESEGKANDEAVAALKEALAAFPKPRT